MTRDELIEVMVLAMLGRRGPGELEVKIMTPMFKRDAAAALTAIEAQGLAVVPVEATEKQIQAGCDETFGPDPYTPEYYHRAGYRAMIEAGKL